MLKFPHDNSPFQQTDASDPQSSVNATGNRQQFAVATARELLDLDRRIAHLSRMIAHHHRATEEREAAEEDAREDARAIAAIERQEQIDADELRDAQDAGDVDADGEPIPYDRYPG